MAERKIEEYGRVLVVEGYGDLLFYAEVLEAVGKHPQVFIKELGGKADLRRKLETLVTPALLAAKEALAFVFDADTKPDATRAELEALLSRLTGQQVVDGKWTVGKPRIGLLIVPGGNAQGEIESLVWHSWGSDPVNAPQKKCIEDYVACMAGQNATAHSPDKGLIGALLAIKSDDDPRLGPGARTNVFDLHRPELKVLRDFLSGF
jgi:hypothetical protein